MFGAGNNNPNPNSPWGSANPAFGTTTSTPTLFGSRSSTTAFSSGRSGSNVFGNVTTAAVASTPAFSAPSAPLFGRGGATTTTVSANPFSKPASTAESVFSTGQHANVFGGGAKPFPATSGSVFGSGAVSTAPAPGAPGSGTETGSQGASLFGGVTPKEATSRTLFGDPKTTDGAGTGFGAGKGVSPVFGASVTGVTTAHAGPGSRTVVFGESSQKAAGAPSNPFSSSSSGGTQVFGGGSTGAFSSSKPDNAKVTSASVVSTGASGRSFSKAAASSSDSSQRLFGKTIVSSSQNVFDKAATSTSTTSPNPFSKPSTSKSEASLFGKSRTSAMAEPSQKVFGEKTTRPGREPATDSAPATIFSRLGAKSKSSSGLFGKDEGSEGPPRPGRRKIIQRTTDTKAAEGEKKGPRLSGRAIASVSREQPTRGERRVDDSGGTEKGSARRKTSPGTDTRALVRRRSTIDDMSQFTALVARNVSPTVNNIVTLRKHFSRFGKVSKVFCNPGKMSANIHFEDHDSALSAKKNGGVMRQGLPKLSLFWKALAPKAGNSSLSDTPTPVQKHSAAASSKTSQPKKLFTEPSGVSDELSSMAGPSDDAFGNEMRTLERPSGLQSDRMAGSLVQPAVKASRSPDRKREPAPTERSSRSSRREKARSVSPVPRAGRAGKEHVDTKGKVVSREESASPIPTSVPLVSVKSLIGKKCVTVQERLDVLIARDRLLREARNAMNKGKDLATARAIRGTCLDMCSEKERYMRQERRRLTMYEVDTDSEVRGVVDHARAVKEYSRSSADQDMPLANELRPPEVLDRTMSYILNNIIQLGDDGKWSDWFEFIWSRTRGIRKDITQQQLCDQTAVALVERCARFHIYCAERLCEEDAAVFDMKINDENLTKCLQTLKELYHDLATKHGQHCQHEAEFRAYVVLMNLNQGDTLRETQQLRTEVRESAPVKFALSVYSALNSNNYIRFFKLVQGASFLNACILHRYFSQVRSAALLTMCMAYSLPGKTAQVPVSDLVRLLGFEDAEEVISFSEHYGLATENDCISMMRNNFMDPETALPKRRAKQLIETKLTTSAGEAMHGGPLPPNDILTPTSSFDADGRFCPDAATLCVIQQQEGDEGLPLPPPPARAPEPAAAQPEPESEPEQPGTKHAFSNDSVKAVAKEMFIEVIEEICREMSQNLVQTCHAFLNMAGPLTEHFLDDQVPLLARQISEEIIEEEKKEKERVARARAEQSILRQRITEELHSELIEEVLRKFTQELAQEGKSDANRQLEEESKDRCSSAYIDDLLAHVLTTEVNQITSDFYEQEVQRKRQALAQAEGATRLLRQRRHFRRWQNQLAGRQRLKSSMLDFPAAPSMDSPRERLQRILPESTGFSVERNAVHLGNNAWLTLTPPNVVVEKENQLICEILRQNEEARQKLSLSRTSIDVCRVVGPALIRNHIEGKTGTGPTKGIERLYWKLLLSLPEPETSHEEDYHDWLINKLSTPDDSFPPEIYHNTVPVIGRSSSVVKDHQGQPVGVHVAVRHVTGVMRDADLSELRQRRHLQATSAVLFVVNHETDTDTQLWQSERRRLDQVLSLCDTTRLALIIAAPEHQLAETQSHLCDLCDDLPFSRVVPFSDDVINPMSTVQVQESLQAMAEHCPSQPPLSAEWLTDYLEHGLQRFFFSKISNSVFSGIHEHHLNQVSREMVELYNAAIARLIKVATDSQLANISWPPIEFCHSNKDLPPPDWNSPIKLGYLGQLLSSLTLPPCPPTQAEEARWIDACDTVWQYVEAVAVETEGTDVFLVSKIRKLLRQAEEAFEDRCLWVTGWKAVEPSNCDVPWNRIIRVCIDHKLAFLNTLVPDSNDNQLEYNEIRVLYDPKLMDCFEVPAEWLSVSRHSPDHSAWETSIRKSVKRKQDTLTPLKSQTTFKSTRRSLTEANRSRLDFEPADPDLLETQVRAGELLGEIALEKRAMDDFEKYLEDLVKEGELALPPVPHLHQSLITDSF